MNSDVEEIKSRLNIVDVLGEYIRLEKAGSNWKANCPFHNEKTPSFMVSEEKQFWHCFGCQKSGDIFSFVMEMEGLEFPEALRQLGEKAGIRLKSYDPKKTEEKNRTLEILELATKFYEVQLWKGEGKGKVMEYLKNRGLKDETIKEFRLGYAPRGWRNLLTFLNKRGYKTEEIIKTGLLVEKSTLPQSSPCLPDRQASKGGGINCYDRFRDRIIFPIADYSGKILGYSARVSPGGDEAQAKYINTPETEVYHKSRALYGIDKARQEMKQKDFALLVEGNMDVIASWQAGIKNTVAVSGTALTLEQIDIIKRYTRNLKMFFDMDSAGEAATKKSVKLCYEKEMSVKVVELPSGKDAADIAKENPETLKKAVGEAKNVMEYFFDAVFRKYNKGNPEDRKKIIDDLLEKIVMLEYLPDKNFWVKKLAERLNIGGANIQEDERALTDMLKKANLKNRIKESFQSGAKNNEVEAKSKMATLTEELIGLIFLSPLVWKEAAEAAARGDLGRGDRLLNIVIEKGEKAGFDFEKFISEISDEQEAVSKLGKIYSEKRYYLDLNNDLKEITLDDPLAEFRNCLQNISKEKKKKELIKIAQDLKMAESIGDKNAIAFLRQEFDKISKELAKLIK